MSRLTCVKPSVSTLRSTIAPLRDAEGHSRSVETWRNWYSLARWKRLRLTTFRRDDFTCQMPACRRLEGNTALLVADHIERHQGDPDLFWNPDNIQTLCKSCHDGTKQAAERRGR
ncbi:MAG: HNH endonuclease [Caulobacter sp.]